MLRRGQARGRVPRHGACGGLCTLGCACWAWHAVSWCDEGKRCAECLADGETLGRESGAGRRAQRCWGPRWQASAVAAGPPAACILAARTTAWHRNIPARPGPRARPQDYHREHGQEVRIVRIFNTYGPRMALDDGRVVSNFVSQAGPWCCTAWPAWRRSLRCGIEIAVQAMPACVACLPVLAGRKLARPPCGRIAMQAVQCVHACMPGGGCLLECTHDVGRACCARASQGCPNPARPRQALKNEPLTLFGDGKQTRSFQYVSDLIEGACVCEGRAGPLLWSSRWAARSSLAACRPTAGGARAGGAQHRSSCRARPWRPCTCMLAPRSGRRAACKPAAVPASRANEELHDLRCSTPLLIISFVPLPCHVCLQA